MSKGDYRTIVRSSAITGSASVLTIVLGFLKLKVVAIYAGTQGVGLLGLYTAATGLVSTASSLGLGSSAVRNIAEAAGSGDELKIAKVIKAMRRLCWVTGLVGAACSFFAAELISKSTFGNSDHVSQIRILSVCILLAQLSAGQGALLRGLRQIKQLALQSVAVGFATMCLAVVAFGCLGQSGVIPFMLSAQVAGLTGTWWYARKIEIPNVKQSFADTMAEGKSMLSLGVAFQLSALVAAGSAYMMGIFLHQKGGVELNGLYQAAWGTSGALARLVLGAMGQDFYPRLAAVAKDDQAAMKMVNQQCEIGVLLALPILAAFAALVPLVIPLFFSKAFVPAIVATVWFVLGAFGQVVSWPLGYLLMASGRGWWYLATELAFALIHIALAYWLIGIKGLEGAGIAWFSLYVIYWIGMSVLIRVLSGQSLSRTAVRMGTVGLALIALASRFGPLWGSLLSLPIAAFSLRSLVRRVGHDNRLASRLISLPLLGKFIAS